MNEAIKRWLNGEGQVVAAYLTRDYLNFITWKESYMSKAEQIVGRLNADETEEVLRECIFALQEERLLRLLTDVLTPDQLDELDAMRGT